MGFVSLKDGVLRFQEDRSPAEIVLCHLRKGGAVKIGSRILLMAEPGRIFEEKTVVIGGSPAKRVVPARVLLEEFIAMCDRLNESELLACAAPVDADVPEIPPVILPRRRCA